ncbi:MAG: oligosaccharide flippase family protein [Bacteroidales bacterium]|nr:oligosaccharide flippase family protein [Bacteroidales bacterium]
MMSETPKHDDATLDHVLKYTGVFGGVQGINILIGVVRNKLASKFLGAAGIGLMGFYSSITDFVNNCSNFGIPISSVQHLSELFEEGDAAAIRSFIRVVRTWCLWSSAVAVLLCAIAAAIYDVRVALLAPMVIGMIITGGEISLLKGLRRLKRVAFISLIAAIATFCLTVPFFWSMGTRGIILSLDCTAVAIMLIHLCFTVPLYAWRVAPFSKAVFCAGLPLLRIGIPYVLTGVVSAAVAVVLQSFLKEHSSETILGYYRVGYTMMVAYAGVIFTALESDFFPRLSSVNHDVLRRNQTINRQIRACMLLLSPMLIALIVMMPLLLQLLYTEEFLPAVGMTVCAAFYMFFRCLSVPIAYTALARGDSRLFLLMEIIYDFFMLGAVIGCYLLWGLHGIGIGLSLSSFFDFMLVGTCYRRIYSFRLERSTWLHTLIQGTFLFLAIVACLVLPVGWKYAVGLLLFLLSVAASYKVLLRESAIVQRLHQRFTSRR